ncbi:MAG: efflux RND transporter periplasmic adaptor subunit [Anaerolineales bacterium]|nr:efflux RND transporter periplasmic adaptor subunit [Anaerolineales bacterium]
MFKNKKVLAITLIVIIILAGGGYYGYTAYAQSSQTVEQTETIQTTVAYLGDLEIFASAAGEVVPSSELSLGFDESGTVSEILVTVGEKVTAGQVLARLQTDNSAEDLAAVVANAELDVLTAQQDLDTIYANHQMEAAQALKAVEDAQTTLDNLSASEDQIASAYVALLSAQDAVVEAQKDRTKLDYARADDLTIQEAYTNYLLAKESYKEAAKAFAEVEHKAITNPERVRALQNLVSAQDKMDLAFANYNYLIIPNSETDIATADADLALAEANLADAQTAYDKLVAGPTPGEVAIAEATLAAAQATYDKIKDAPDSLEVAIAEAKLTSAQADLALAQEKQSIIELTSPIDATVTNIGASVGEKVGTTGIITVADLAHPLLEVYLDETDLANVALGYEAEIVFDAYPDDTFHGTVVEVSPVLESVGGVAAVKTVVQLTDYAKTTTLPAGLSASVDVIGGRATNAVLIPVEALHQIGTDEYSVFVMENGEPKIRFVEVGIQDFTTAEIKSGLSAGDVVTTGIVETGQ